MANHSSGCDHEHAIDRIEFSSGFEFSRTDTASAAMLAHANARVRRDMTCATRLLGVFHLAVMSWLGGNDSVVWPAAAVSAGGFALNAGVLAYLGRLERTRRIGE
jgi:Family of unknown function (DUF6755)